jgi:ABC-type cobalamin/Fe3+-siderophores transport system ATPase subunit
VLRPEETRHAVCSSGLNTPWHRILGTGTRRIHQCTRLPHRYRADYIAKLRSLDPGPSIEIKYDELTIVLQQSGLNAEVETFVGQLLRQLASVVRAGPTTDLRVLHGVRGVLRPGTSTLILGAPGSGEHNPVVTHFGAPGRGAPLIPVAGKSALMRALAGRHPTGGVNGKGSNVDTAITYNGLTAPALAKAGINLSKLAAYAPQEDLHEPLLTVRETFEIAHALSTPRPPADAPAAVHAEWSARVDSVIDVLGLRECQNTLIGNEQIRGVSGGQKKRVTVGEALLANARILALDSITNGLDASTALDIVSFLRDWAHECRGTVVMALEVRACVWEIECLRRSRCGRACVRGA